MRIIQQFILFITTTLVVINGFSQPYGYIDDKSFIGSWKLEKDGDSPIYIRCDSLFENQEGFKLSLDETSIRRKKNTETTSDINGRWWSFSIGHCDMQYEDVSLDKEIIERFEYLSTNDSNRIIRVAYEEHHMEKNSEFIGIWKQNDAGNSKEIIYESCSLLGIDMKGIKLLADGSGTILLIHKNKYLSINVSWWVSDEKRYFDMQYYNPKTKFIVIEGFEVIEGTIPLQIKRIRFDEFRE